MTPDIGNLIQYLTVSNSVSWDAFKDAYIRESFRRNARWIDSRYYIIIFFLSTRKLTTQHRFPDDHPKIGPSASDEALVEYWNEGTSVSMKLMLFNVLFLDVVAHPPGKNLTEVKQTYPLIVSFVHYIFIYDCTKI